METASAVTAHPLLLDEAGTPPAAILRGTARGLEINVDGQATTTAIVAAVMKRLDEAPGFFRGSDVRIRVEDGPLAPGCLARLDEIAVMFELRIVEMTAAEKKKLATGTVLVADADAVPLLNLAAGSAPSPAFEDEAPTNANASKIIAMSPPTGDVAEPVEIGLAATDLLDVSALDAVTVTGADLDAANEEAEGISFEEPTGTAVPVQLASTPEVPLVADPGTRIVIGPVRSGVILEHVGHLFIFGDINPGAEVRASGNIVVLGRLRGTAHAGIGQDVGFILALRLEPQQLRLGRQVARAADSDIPASEPEIAYLTNGGIAVERYAGRLPTFLATSL
jgi:septum formation inhibitor MinC